MAWLNRRQEVLAHNIANANTPHYAARDLKPLSFGQRLEASGSLAPVQTSPLHLTAGDAAQPQFGEAELRHGRDTTLTGNSVVIEDQLMKVSETQIDYQMVANVYRKHVEMLKMALGRGNP